MRSLVSVTLAVSYSVWQSSKCEAPCEDKPDKRGEKQRLGDGMKKPVCGMNGNMMLMVWIGRTRCFPFWQEFSKVRSSKFAIWSIYSRSLLCRDFSIYPNTSGPFSSFSKSALYFEQPINSELCSAMFMPTLTLQFPSLILSNLPNSPSKSLQNPT